MRKTPQTVVLALEALSASAQRGKKLALKKKTPARQAPKPKEVVPQEEPEGDDDSSSSSFSSDEDEPEEEEEKKEENIEVEQEESEEKVETPPSPSRKKAKKAKVVEEGDEVIITTTNDLKRIMNIMMKRFGVNQPRIEKEPRQQFAKNVPTPKSWDVGQHNRPIQKFVQEFEIWANVSGITDDNTRIRTLPSVLCSGPQAR